MTKKGKKKGLRDRVKSGLEGLDLDVPPVPTKGKEVDEPVNTAYCPLLLGRCSNVACSECALIPDSYEDHVWVCTTCTEGFTILPYWGTGECAVCGYKSIVLMLGIP